MKRTFCTLLAVATGLLAACTQTESTTTTTRTSSATSGEGSGYKISGNRSADPLANYNGGSNVTTTTNTSQAGFTNTPNVAQHSGSSTFPSSSTVSGGR